MQESLNKPLEWSQSLLEKTPDWLQLVDNRLPEGQPLARVLGLGTAGCVLYGSVAVLSLVLGAPCALLQFGLERVEAAQQAKVQKKTE